MIAPALVTDHFEVCWGPIDLQLLSEPQDFTGYLRDWQDDWDRRHAAHELTVEAQRDAAQFRALDYLAHSRRHRNRLRAIRVLELLAAAALIAVLLLERT